MRPQKDMKKELMVMADKLDQIEKALHIRPDYHGLKTYMRNDLFS